MSAPGVPPGAYSQLVTPEAPAERLPELLVWMANVYGGVPPLAENVTLLPTANVRAAGLMVSDPAKA